jgi:soluble lytic murein transglycosylase-like protein
MSFDKFALGLVGALQQAQQNDLRQQEMEKANKLLEMQLKHYNVVDEEAKAKTELLKQQLTGNDALASFAASLSAPPSSAPAPQAGPKQISDISPATIPGVSQYEPFIQQASVKTGVPAEVLRAHISVESGGKVDALSPKGAAGVAQFMPDTAKQYGVNVSDPESSIHGMARYLSDLQKQFGSWDLAAAAYNAGPGRVKQYGGVPPFAETRNHLKKLDATGQMPPGTFDVAVGGNQASDAYPSTPAPGRSAGLPVAQASPMRELEAINSWERENLGRAMSLPSVVRKDAVSMVKEEAKRRRGELTFKYNDEHYERRYRDLQDRHEDANRRAADRLEMAKDSMALREEIANLKREQGAAKEESGRLARLDDIAKGVSTFATKETDELGKEKTSYTLDTGMQNLLSASLQNIVTYNAVPETQWKSVGNELAGAYKKALVAFKAEGMDPEAAAQRAIDAAHAIVHERWRRKNPDAEAAQKGAADANAKIGKLESDNDAQDVDSRTKLPEQPVTAPAPKSSGLPLPTPAATPAPTNIPAGTKPADVEAAMQEEERLKEQRAGDLKILRNVGIPTTARSAGQAADFLDRAFVRPAKDALAGAASLYDTAVGRPARALGEMASRAYDNNFGAEGLKRDIESALAAYQNAPPRVRDAMDVQAKRKWGFTVLELLQERKNPTYKEAR